MLDTGLGTEGQNRHALQLAETDLTALDPLRYNNGINPYKNAASSPKFAHGPGYYRRYIEKVGFLHGKHVLDLGCGFGEWTLFLAETNLRVTAIDRNPGAINLAANMAGDFGFSNIDFSTGDFKVIQSLPGGSFDRIWIRGALMFFDRGFVLSQAYRLLEPQGKIYVGAYHSVGRLLKTLVGSLHQWPITKKKPKYAMGSMCNGPLFDGRPNHGTLETCETVCSKFGFRLVRADVNGYLDLTGNNAQDKARPKDFDAFDDCIEFVAEKPGPSA